MTTLPDTAQTLITQMLVEVDKHPRHQLAPLSRYGLYAVLEPAVALRVQGKRLEREPRFVIGWLGIITARRVLARWLKVKPKIDQPYANYPEEWLALAEAVLRGEADFEAACERASNDWYIEEPSFFDDELDKGMPVAAYAWAVALRALNETLGWIGVEGLADWVFNLDPEAATLVATGVVERLPDDDQYISGREWDSAATAWLATMYDSYNPSDKSIRQLVLKGAVDRYDAKKSYEFWHWWLTEAVPLAWLKAQDQEKAQKRVGALARKEAVQQAQRGED